MGTVTAQTIINRAATVLEDTGNTTFTRAELLDWLNEAQSVLVSVAPGANSKRSSVALVAGTSQTLPTSAVVLIDVPRNTNGGVIRPVAREALDGGPVDWHTVTQTALVRNFAYDANVPDVFYVYPPNDGTGAVDIVYAEQPPVITSESEAISVKDAYQAALLNYVLFRVYSHDTDYLQGGKEAAAAYYTAFERAVTARVTFDAAANANAALMPMNPANQGSTK